MADMFTNPLRSISSRPYLQFMEGLLPRMAALTPKLARKCSESFIFEESMTP